MSFSLCTDVEPVVSDGATSADQTLTSGTPSNYHGWNSYACTCKFCVTFLGLWLWSMAFYSTRCPLMIFRLSAIYFCLFNIFEEPLLLPWFPVICFWPHFFYLIQPYYQLSIHYNSKPLPFVLKLSSLNFTTSNLYHKEFHYTTLYRKREKRQFLYTLAIILSSPVPVTFEPGDSTCSYNFCCHLQKEDLSIMCCELSL